jgi:death-on-curing protein
MADEPEFLDVDDVIEIHASQLEVYGGSAGLRDRGLLESAVAQPQASFGGELAHDGLFAMAAAYLFHIVSNHPFVDGNKRAGMLSAVVFLDVNGISIDHPSDALYDLTMRVAEGRIDKPAIAAELERIVKSGRGW